jgi:hypothetical protein
MGGMPQGKAGMGPGMGKRAPRDCAQAANPEACKAHQQARADARAACQDKVGPDRKACLNEQMQNFDCAKSGNLQQCEARKKVYQECKGQAGPAFRQCVQQKMPPVDCSQSADPQRCALHQKTREACKDKFGPDHRSCVLQNLGIK